MSFDPLYLFVFSGLFTPGPNVILLTTSGVRFGFRRTLPHVLGVAAGVGVTAGLTGLGLGAVLARMPALELALKIMAFAWILWMAWKIYGAASLAQVEGKDRPFTFLEAVLFQWVNPKVWAIAFSAAAGYTSDLSASQAGITLALAFSCINLGVCLFYATLGHSLAPALRRPAVWRIFMTLMAVLLVLAGGLIFL